MDIKPNELPAGRFLYDTGLLFEINRRILHPLGLALRINYDDQDGALNDSEAIISLSQIMTDYRDDPEGMLFDEQALEEGYKKYKKFFDEFAKDKILQRTEMLGYCIQSITHLPGALVAPIPVAVEPAPNSNFEVEEVEEEQPEVDDEAIKLLIEKNNQKRTKEPLMKKASSFTGVKKIEDGEAVIEDSDKEDKKSFNKIKKFIGVPHKKQGNPYKECISTKENTVYSSISGGTGIVFCSECGRTLLDSDLSRD